MAKHKQIPDEEVLHYEPPRKNRQQAPPKMQPPLTPMIDVTFQLLLFFLLTCQFRQAEGQIPGTLPPQDQGPPSEVQKDLRIVLRRTGQAEQKDYKGDTQIEWGLVEFIVGNASVGVVDPQTLYEQLLEAQKVVGGGDVAKARKDVPVMIQPADDVPWGYVVQAWAQAARAKFEKIGFTSRPS